MVKALALLLALCASGPAAAQCRLALALALDVSSSVDASEHLLQRRGLAAALNDADVRRAILSGAPRHVALAAYEWSGRDQHQMLLNWTVLDGDTSIDGAVAAILSPPRSHDNFPTALGYALGYGATLLERGPDCTRRVLDVSGDGRNNEGFAPDLAYQHFPFAGVTVNGLAVLNDNPALAGYFEREVIRGPRAFVEVSQGYEGYREAMTRKLFREINDLVVGQTLQLQKDPRG
ncbi:DUF1194 domain-containing protein [Primorskyibacter flagellatus]|uniref:DUF1194 domain-containing protein n=1 Tax=Primorskyibacter flagellatus TaxID=1387277 RepID=UPI003A8E3FA8